jgi:hypothetical protein
MIIFIWYKMTIRNLYILLANNFIVWNILQCSPLKVNRRFGVTCLHLLGQRISQARNQPAALLPHRLVLVSCMAYSSFDPEDVGDIFL